MGMKKIENGWGHLKSLKIQQKKYRIKSVNYFNNTCIRN